MSFFLREQPILCPLPTAEIEWEECTCHLCGSSRWAPLVEGTDHAAPILRPGEVAAASGMWFLVVQCQECGLCFTNPRPSQRSMSRFYAADYRPHRPFNEADKEPAAWRHGLSRLCPFLSDVRKVMPLHGRGRLLDFGCGSGSFLSRMHRQGWQVMGMDPSEAAVNHVRQELSLPALVGTLPHEELAAASFDVITMWQALEHVPWPREVLREARRLLAPGGKLIVAVPNIDSLPFRLFGPSWIGLDLPRHLTHFTPTTLRQMLRRAGFRPGPVRMIRRSAWLRSSAHVCCRSSLHPPRWLRWLKGRTLSNLASWLSFLMRRSDCMLVTAVAG